MPYYDPYQSSPAMQQYMPQSQYMPQGQQIPQGQYTTQGQYMPQSQYAMPGQSVPQGQYAPSQELANIADLQQYIYPANLPEALKLMADALAGEKEDRQFYDYLISTAPSENDKEIIRGIRDNEIRHFSLFRLMYYQLTGQVLPPPKEKPFAKPATYCDGLKKALIGEENAVVRYRKILFAMQSRVHINMMTEIISDELRHGTLYSYLYTKHDCKV